MTKPILAFDFQDLEGCDTVRSCAACGHCEMTFSGALIEDGYFGPAPRFQYATPGHGTMAPGKLASLLVGKTGYSVAMWLMPYQSFHGAHTFRLLTAYGTGDRPLLELDYSSPAMVLRLGEASGVDAPIALTFPYALDTAIPPFDAPNTNDGVWQHLTLTVDLLSSCVRLYINGTEIAAQEETAASFAAKEFPKQERITLPDCIGGDATLSARSFNGIIGTFAVYDKALSDREIGSLFDSCCTPQAASPTTRQRLLQLLARSLQDSFVLMPGSTNVIHRGRVIKADREDYTRKVIFKEEMLLLPADLCDGHFTVSGIPSREIGGALYYPADRVAAANGLRYTVPAEQDGLFLLLSEGVAVDPDALEVLRAFFTSHPHEPRLPVERSRRVVASSDTSRGNYTYSPSIARLGATLYASRDISCLYTEVYASSDSGESWTYQGRADGLWWATLFAHCGRLYLLGRYTAGGLHGSGPHYIGITESLDGGKTWSSIDQNRGGISYDGGFGVHCAPTPVLFHRGRLYKAFEGAPLQSRRAFIVSTDVGSDLCDPASWQVSDYFTGFGIPNEGNAVRGPDGSVWILARFITGKAYLMKYDEEQNKIVPALGEGAASLIDFPSTASKFTVRYDDGLQKYITIVNAQTDPNKAYQRNYAMLAVSDDLIHWQVKETLLSDRELYDGTVSAARHAFQYVDWILDGADILFVVRESCEDAKNFHDSNYLTFYRLKNYRALIN